MEARDSSEVSPPQAANDNYILSRPTRITNISRDRAKFLADLDGTLTKPGVELLIEKFVRQVQVGSADTRGELIGVFDKWAEAKRKEQNPVYEDYLANVGNLWAKALGRGDHKLTRPELMQVTENWFKNGGVKQLMDYAPGVIGLAKKREFDPILVTGAPYEIAAHFAHHLGIEHAFAMEAEVDGRGNYTGNMEHNTGLGRAKKKICALLQEARHKILFAMGDTHSDMVLMRAAIELRGRHDSNGRSVMINPSPENLAGLNKWAPDYVSDGQVVHIARGMSCSEVIREIGHLLDDTLKENRMKNALIEQAA